MSCSPMTADRVGLEPGFDAEHGERDLDRRTRQRLRPAVDIDQIEQPVIGQQVAHAVARAVAPQREHDALAGGLQRVRRGP